MTRRVAVVDLGTNSTRLLVADVTDGRIDELERRLTITRLGEGVDERRRLLPLPIARVRNCLADFRHAAEHGGAEVTLAVATSAVRDAENGEAFLGEVEWSYGFVSRLLSGDEEAELTFRGVAAGRELEPDTLVVDVGGGSTELVLGGPGGVDWHRSLDVGCVRMTERFGDDIAGCARAVRAELPDLCPAHAIGVAGTMTTLATLDLGLAEYDPNLVHGHVVTRDSLDVQLDRLASLSLDERRQVQGLEPERAPVIVAGLVVLREVLAAAGLGAIGASERDLLHGAAFEAAELPAAGDGAVPAGAHPCC